MQVIFLTDIGDQVPDEVLISEIRIRIRRNESPSIWLAKVKAFAINNRGKAVETITLFNEESTKINEFYTIFRSKYNVVFVDETFTPSDEDLIKIGRRYFELNKHKPRCPKCADWENFSSDYNLCHRCCTHDVLEYTVLASTKEKYHKCKGCGKGVFNLEDYLITRKGS